MAPAGTPENVIKFYEDAFQKLMEDADYLKAAEAAGMETDYKNSADTAALIKQQQDFFRINAVRTGGHYEKN